MSGREVGDLPANIADLVVRYRLPPERFLGLPDDVLAEIDVTEADVQTEEESGGYFEHANARARWTAECYTSAGWPSRVDPPGSNVVVYEGANAPVFAASVEKRRCDAEALLRYPYPPPPQTREEWRRVYQRQLDAAACLESEGYALPDPPSLDAFIDSGGRWSAYAFVPDQISGDEWNRLLATCPQP